QEIFLAVDRNRADVPNRFVTQIGDTGVNFALTQHIEKHRRCAAKNSEADIRMTHLQGNRELGDQRHGGWNRGNAQVGLRTIFQAEDVLAHCARVTDQTMCPKEDALAFRCEALEPRGTLHKRRVKRLLETLDAERKSRLGDSAALGGASEMLLAR